MFGYITRHFVCSLMAISRRLPLPSSSAILVVRWHGPGRLSPSSTRATQPYMACKLTTSPWNCFLQPGILKHDHESYFPRQNDSRYSSAWNGSQYLNCTYSMVPRRNGPNSEDSPCPSVTSGWCSAEGFYSTVFEHWTVTPLGKLFSRPSASNHNFLSNSSWGAW